MLWKVLQILTIGLFLGQGLLGYVMWLEIPVPAGATGVAVSILGVCGFVFVILLNDVEEQRDRLRRELKKQCGEVRNMIGFVCEVVKPESVAVAFDHRKSVFDDAATELIGFYRERDEMLAKILQEHPDDADMCHYNEARQESEGEEQRLKFQAVDTKQGFWAFHEIVGRVNAIHAVADMGLSFDRPISIKKTDTTLLIGDNGGTSQ